jgi:hypothetical protein
VLWLFPKTRVHKPIFKSLCQQERGRRSINKDVLVQLAVLHVDWRGADQIQTWNFLLIIFLTSVFV